MGVWVAKRIFTELKLLREGVFLTVLEKDGQCSAFFSSTSLEEMYGLRVEGVRREGAGYVLTYTHGVGASEQQFDTVSRDGRGSRTETVVFFEGRSEPREVLLEEA